MSQPYPNQYGYPQQQGPPAYGQQQGYYGQPQQQPPDGYYGQQQPAYYVQQQPADTRKSGGDGNAGKCCLVALLACCFGCCLGECCD